MVGTDFPKGIHHICVAVQTKDLFLGSSNRELAPSMNVFVGRQVEGTKAGLGEVREEDIPSLAKVGLPHFVAGLEVRGEEKLLRLLVTNCNHVCGADFWSDGDIAGEVEVNRQRDEFVKWHEVVRCDQQDVEHQHKCFLVWFVYVRCVHQEEVGRLVNEGKHVAVASDVVDVLDRLDECVMVKSAWRKSVTVGHVNEPF